MRVKSNQPNKFIQVIGLVFLTLLLALTIFPQKAEASWTTGNDGYFLSITSDPGRVRVVPVAIYDKHSVKDSSKAFLEWKNVEVYYAKLTYNVTTFNKLSNSTGKDDWKEFAQGIGGKFDSNSPLGWTFPGFAGHDKAENYSATQDDMDRALWVSDTLVQDFNNAISFVHKNGSERGNAPKNLNETQFANLMIDISNKARKAVKEGKRQTMTYGGVNFSFVKASSNSKLNLDRVPHGIRKDAYVHIYVTSDPSRSVTLVEYVDKGYRSDNNADEYSPMRRKITSEFQKLSDSDVKYLTWKHVVLQANSNWAINGLTFTNINEINKTNKVEQWMADAGTNALVGLRQMMGMYDTSELIMNQGNRGTNSFYKGIMPQSWMDSTSVLHWICYAVAWMLIIGSIVKLLVQRNVAAINPSARVDMVNGIKNLMIVGFALSIYDLVFAGLTEMNFIIVDLLSSTGVGTETFGTAPISAGAISAVIVSFVFFCLDVYFNFFYIARALMVAILYAVGPLYVASIAYGEKYRQIFGSYTKELIGNIFVQSFQAILVVFFVGISMTAGLRTIETMVLLFTFIPLTKFFKESIGASSSVTDSLTGSALGAGAGMAAGLMGSMYMNRSSSKQNDKQKGTSTGGNDIGMKSGTSYNASTKSGSGGSMTHVDQETRKEHGHSNPGIKAHGKTAGRVAAKGAGMAAKTAVRTGATLTGLGLMAGGAATGMRGASQIGGVMAGTGVHQLGASAVRGAQSVGGLGADLVNRGLDKKRANNLIASESDENGNLTSGAVEPLSVQENDDGTAIHTFDKSKFSAQTGINSMNDLDNVGNEIEVATGYSYTKRAKGFETGHPLNGTAYASNIRSAVDAFQNKDREAMQYYKSKGINDVRVGKDGKASFIMDKNRSQVHGVHQSGHKIYLQRDKESGSNPLFYATQPPKK